jgi:Raf kinase inhibitor-like YbhB/YbcL family protein
VATPVEANQRIIINTPFLNKPEIPIKFTCDSINTNPPIIIKNIPHNIKSLAIILDDPDAPSKTWVHWILYNINIENISKNISKDRLNTVTIIENNDRYTLGKNSWGNNRYEGPCPPNGKHRYFLKIYFLNKSTNFRKGLSKDELIKNITNITLEKRELVNIYKRK